MNRLPNPFIQLLSVALLIGSLLPLQGCSTGMQYQQLPPPPSPDREEEFRLGPGDILQFVFYYQPELQMIQEVRPDGMISLQLLGETMVTGLTPSELKQELVEAYSRYFDHFDVAILVSKVAKNEVYVSGATALNQMISYNGDLTVLQALTQAGGVPTGARLDSVLVIRNQGTSDPLVYKVNIKDAREKGGQDFMLRNHDVLYVPTKNITKVNQFVAQYIDGIIPRRVAVAFGFSYPLRGIKSNVDVNLPDVE